MGGMPGQRSWWLALARMANDDPCRYQGHDWYGVEPLSVEIEQDDEDGRGWGEGGRWLAWSCEHWGERLFSHLHCDSGLCGSEGRDWMEWFVIDFFISIGPSFFHWICKGRGTLLRPVLFPTWQTKPSTSAVVVSFSLFLFPFSFPYGPISEECDSRVF